MQVGLNLNPLVPLFPVQPERQTEYPKALGPTFVGKPYLTFPEARAATQDPLAAAAKKAAEEPGASAAKGANALGTYGNPGGQAAAHPLGGTGSKVDLLG